MAKSVFYSFHYDRDVFRVQQVRNINALEGQPLLNSQKWEEVKKKGDAAVHEWIDKEMNYKRAVIVLIGQETAGRDFVNYEIQRAWDIKKPLLGVYIHGLANMDSKPDRKGSNPFVAAGIAGIPTFDPTVSGIGGINTQSTYNNLRANLERWSSMGAVRS